MSEALSELSEGQSGLSEGHSDLSDNERNVRFFDHLTGDLLGGLFQNGSVTEANFIDMLNIVLVIVPRSSGASLPFTVQSRSGQVIGRTNEPLAPGNYDVCVADGSRSIGSDAVRRTWLTRIDSIGLSDEQFIRRIPSHNVSNREIHFKNGVRARDGKCVFTGIANTRNRIRMNRWRGWEACHVFPLERESYWCDNHFDRWITNEDSGAHSSSSINSVQNGLLMMLHVHQLFDDYSVSVNPDVSNWVYNRSTKQIILLIYF